MPRRKTLASRTVDETLEAKLAMVAFVNAVISAAGDATIDPTENHELAQLGAKAMRQISESLTLAEQANAHAWAIDVLEYGGFDTEYLQRTARDYGYDPDALNALVTESETAAA